MLLYQHLSKMKPQTEEVKDTERGVDNLIAYMKKPSIKNESESAGCSKRLGRRCKAHCKFPENAAFWAKLVLSIVHIIEFTAYLIYTVYGWPYYPLMGPGILIS